MNRGNKRGSGHGSERDTVRVFQALSMLLQFSLHMLVPILLCAFLGMWIDKMAGTGFWVIILFFVGALAGFTNVFRFAMRINGSAEGNAEEEDGDETAIKTRNINDDINQDAGKKGDGQEQ